MSLMKLFWCSNDDNNHIAKATRLALWDFICLTLSLGRNVLTCCALSCRKQYLSQFYFCQSIFEDCCNIFTLYISWICTVLEYVLFVLWSSIDSSGQFSSSCQKHNIMWINILSLTKWCIECHMLFPGKNGRGNLQSFCPISLSSCNLGYLIDCIVLIYVASYLHFLNPCDFHALNRFLKCSDDKPVSY